MFVQMSDCACSKGPKRVRVVARSCASHHAALLALLKDMDGRGVELDTVPGRQRFRNHPGPSPLIPLVLDVYH